MSITSGQAAITIPVNTNYRTVYTVIGGTAAASQTIVTGYTGTAGYTAGLTYGNPAGATHASLLSVTRIQWSVTPGPSDYINLNWGGITAQTFAMLAGSGTLDMKSDGVSITNGAFQPNGTIVVQQSPSAPPYFVMIEVQKPYSGVVH